jgi:hypothetical protein
MEASRAVSFSGEASRCAFWIRSRCSTRTPQCSSDNRFSFFFSMVSLYLNIYSDNRRGFRFCQPIIFAFQNRRLRKTFESTPKDVFTEEKGTDGRCQVGNPVFAALCSTDFLPNDSALLILVGPLRLIHPSSLP